MQRNNIYSAAGRSKRRAGARGDPQSRALASFSGRPTPRGGAVPGRLGRQTQRARTGQLIGSVTAGGSRHPVAPAHGGSVCLGGQLPTATVQLSARGPRMASQSSSMTNLWDVVVETIRRPMLYSKKPRSILVFIVSVLVAAPRRQRRSGAAATSGVTTRHSARCAGRRGATDETSSLVRPTHIEDCLIDR
eukprot:COSAG06_NODE_14741_length_1129_cov_4.925243_1_plen_191_part_00